MMCLVSSIERSIAERRLLGRGQKILVAVSGGLDSMVLLEALQRLSQEHGWRLLAAHFNHQLRGRSSDADERFVRQKAEKLGIPFIAGRGDVKRFARQHKLSVEMAARRLRHEFLARTARRWKATTVALGHQAGDQLELFFLRLLRGTGSEGLAGMKWRNPSPVDPKIILVRPLLGCSKAELQQFSRQEGIPFREDQTNSALDILRNRFRHELLPLLVKHYQPALSKTTLRLMEVLEAESEFITQTAAGWLETKRPSFDQLPVAVQRRGLQLQLFRLGLKADFDLIEHLRLRAGSPVTLEPGVAVRRDATGAVETVRHRKPQFDAARLVLKLTRKRGSITFDGLRITWNIQAYGAPLESVRMLPAKAGVPAETDELCGVRPSAGAATRKREPAIESTTTPENADLAVAEDGHTPINRSTGTPDSAGSRPSRRLPTHQDYALHARTGQESFDADKVGSTIALRHWQPGDRLQPSGMRKSVKLQDLLSNQKVPRPLRHRLTVATTARGELFWVEGLRIAEVRRLNWSWQPASG